MPKLHFPTRALTAAVFSSSLCFAAQADTLVDIYELALENDAQLKAQIAQYSADIELEKLALAHDKAKANLEGKTVRKVIVVPGRIVNIVVS